MKITLTLIVRFLPPPQYNGGELSFVCGLIVVTVNKTHEKTNINSVLVHLSISPKLIGSYLRHKSLKTKICMLKKAKSFP